MLGLKWTLINQTYILKEQSKLGRATLIENKNSLKNERTKNKREKCKERISQLPVMVNTV